MKARHPIWNILVVLGVLYVIVFGFLYVYMQRNAAPAQVTVTADESDSVAREVDILDAPLLAEAVEDELEPIGAAVERSVEDAASTDVTPEAEPTFDELTADLNTTDAEPSRTGIEEALDVSSDEAEPDADLSDLGEEAEPDADLTDLDEAAGQEADSGEIASEEVPEVATEADPSQTAEATDPDAEVVEAPLGSSEPYRYNLNEMEKNTKIETEQGWVTYEGKIDSPDTAQRYFFIVQSLIKEPPTLFSQGELKLDEAGNFETRAKYATYSEFYKTYVITTGNDQAADSFSAEGSSIGMPSGFRVVWPVLEVLVD